MKVTACPFGTEGVAGLTLMPVITAAVTVRLAADDEMPFNAAVTVVEPAAIPVAIPVVLVIVVTAVFPDDQLAWLVIFAVVPSE